VAVLPPNYSGRNDEVIAAGTEGQDKPTVLDGLIADPGGGGQ
jgi:hypothetical protein